MASNILTDWLMPYGLLQEYITTAFLNFFQLPLVDIIQTLCMCLSFFGGLHLLAKYNKLDYFAKEQTRMWSTSSPNRLLSPLGACTSLQLSFWDRIAASRTILLTGCGGGFDVVQGLPLFFALREMGKEVHLGNLTFSNIQNTVKGTCRVISSMSPPTSPIFAQKVVCLEVTSETENSSNDIYFPEKYLAKWFEQKHKERLSIYCFERVGVAPLTDAYQKLVASLGVDTIICVDGGTDSLMAGDEDGLGTPTEDMASLCAIQAVTGVDTKILVCSGFGVDRFHGVSDVASLRAVSELTQTDGFLGSFTMLKRMSAVQEYMEACEYLFDSMPNSKSIVASCIIDSIEGKFGNVHSNSRTKGSELFINPLMSMMWCFSLPHVVSRLQYSAQIASSKAQSEMTNAIAEYRETISLRSVEEFPTTYHF